MPAAAVAVTARERDSLRIESMKIPSNKKNYESAFGKIPCVTWLCVSTLHTRTRHTHRHETCGDAEMRKRSADYFPLSNVNQILPGLVFHSFRTQLPMPNLRSLRPLTPPKPLSHEFQLFFFSPLARMGWDFLFV